MNRVRYLLFVTVAFVCMVAWGQEGISERAYWIDLNTTNMLSLGQNSDQLDISDLSPGIHIFSMRVKDNKGLWSSAVTKYFVIPSPFDVEEKATSIVAREYWIDGKVTARTALDESPTIVSLLDLDAGFHSYTIRVQDNLGIWSSAVTQYFVLPRAEDLVIDQASIVRYLYWFDNNVTSYLVADADGATGIVPLDMTGLTTGAHTIYWRVGDSKGAWSDKVYSSLFRYTMPDTGIGTFSNDVAMELPHGMTAQYTTDELSQSSGGRIYVRPVDIQGNVLPAETGLVLKGEGGVTYTLVQSDATGPSIAVNTLVPVLEATNVTETEGEYTNFMYEDGAFVKIDDANGVMIAANQAYLRLPTDKVNDYVVEGGISPIWVNGIATSIDKTLGTAEKNQSEVFYDLQGRRLSSKKAVKGIYIINGRKVVKP